MNVRMKQQILIRNQQPGDEAFIWDSYMKFNWHRKENTTTLKKETWEAAQRRKLQNVFKTRVIKIACSSKYPDVIFGYGFWDDVSPFIYIKREARKPEYYILERLTEAIERDKYNE